MASLSCPFCDFVDQDSYFLLQHVELIHPEGGDSPFIAKESDDSATGGNSNGHNEATEGTSKDASVTRYVPCPYNCGEQLLEDELTSHTDFHVAERMALEEGDADTSTSTIALADNQYNDKITVKDTTNSFTTDLPKALRNREHRRNSPKRGQERWSFREFLLGTPVLPQRQAVKKTLSTKEHGVKRLGKAELGPYAHERQMPMWLREMLEEGARVTSYNKIGHDGSIIRVKTIANETPDLIPILAHLSDLDPNVERAFYCSPGVRHIVKMANEGGFCGYRNIQMLISYIRDTDAEGCEHFESKIPTILKLQDMIERAWDMGFNSTGRVETGGIRGTRKYIGTPEAQALFQSLLIPCEANAFSTSEDLPGYKALLLAVGEYFSDDDSIDLDQKLHITSRPPIYFQHQGHSLTIVGIEVTRDRGLNLVVFDPMYKVSPGLLKLRNASSFRISQPDRLLKAHRRGSSYLAKYKDFEILKLKHDSHIKEP